MVFKAVVNKPFPIKLALFLKLVIGAEIFVETGTYLGDTARLCASFFRQVYTVEGVTQRYEELIQQAWPDNIKLIGGDSGDVMLNEIDDVDESIVFWLDAHWFHNGFPYNDDPLAVGVSACPLLEELEAVTPRDCAIIDDAMFFLAPPSGREMIADWPTISDIVKSLPFHYVFLYRETLVAVPVVHKDCVVDWIYKHRDDEQLMLTYKSNGERYFTPADWQEQLGKDMLNE